MEAVSRLGKPEQVADTAVAAYRRRSFLGRHPMARFLVFGLSPIVAFVALLGALALTEYHIHWHPWGGDLDVLICSTLASTLYCELALRLGLGKKWFFASCGMLGVFALLMQYRIYVGVYPSVLVLLVQLAAPLAVGWWYANGKHNARYVATTFFVFAILPFISYEILWIASVLTVPVVVNWVLRWSTVFVPLLLGIGALVVMIRCYWKLAKRFGWGWKWLIVSCLTLATFPVIVVIPLSLMFIAPTAVASFLYCKLAVRSGVGWTWMFVSCAVLAGYAALQSVQGHYFEYYTESGHQSCDWLMVCVVLAQVVIPFAIGWWFLRRQDNQGQLQLVA